ncbi:MAG: extracellular solute-binding protein [Oscillospiraceae bacterium]
MKKFLALALAATMSLSLVACGPKAPAEPTPPADPTPTPVEEVETDLTKMDFGSGAPVALKLWGSQEDQAMLGEMIESFKANYAGTQWDITTGVVGEADAKTKYLEDPAAAADVFAYANDQLRDLVKAGGLYELSGQFKDQVLAENGEGSIGAATLDGKLYSFPMTADNGYFLYYDKSVITDPSSLDGILAAANAAGKKVFMDVSNGWYIASFFLGAGCTLGLDAAGVQTCDFNSANGVAAGEAIKTFTADPAFITGDDAVLTGGFTDGSVVAGVSGTWNADAISAALGENYAATKLPTFNVGGTEMQMSSFGGYKQVGVNSQTKNPDAAMLLAQWLTNEENQVKRFTDRAMGPSNVKAAANPDVMANPALAALALQGSYAVSQNDVLGKYWEPSEAFGTAMETKDYAMSVQEQLDALVAQTIAP